MIGKRAASPTTTAPLVAMACGYRPVVVHNMPATFVGLWRSLPDLGTGGEERGPFTDQIAVISPLF
jgi:hypothetical protein